MSEVQNWGKMFAVPDKGEHSLLALLGGFYLLLGGKKKVRVAECLAPLLFWLPQVQKCFLLLPLESALERQDLHHIWLTYLNNFVAFFSLFLLLIGSPLLRVSLQIVH